MESSTGRTKRVPAKTGGERERGGKVRNKERRIRQREVATESRRRGLQRRSMRRRGRGMMRGKRQ